MTNAFLRGAAIAFAAILPIAASPHVALGQNARVEAAQDNPELRKRADALFKGVGEIGGKVSWGALEAGAGGQVAGGEDVGDGLGGAGAPVASSSKRSCSFRRTGRGPRSRRSRSRRSTGATRASRAMPTWR